MKKMCVILLVLLMLLLPACGQEEARTVYSVGINNVQMTVDTQNMTISDGMHTYQFEITGNNITITYPNGATFYWSWSGNVGSGGWSEDYDDSTYTDGHILLQALEMKPGTQNKRERSGNPLAGLLILGLGLWNAVAPYSSWYLSHGWRYKDAEPSDAALGFTRFSGIAAIIVGIILLLV